MKIRKSLPTELAWVNAQYASINFVPSTDADLIAIAEINGVKVGLGRITQVDTNVGELGGIFVLPEFRGRSVAAGIIEFLLKDNKENLIYSTLFCIPFTHLNSFYHRFGFLPAEQSMPLPDKIIKKMNWCKQTYDSPVILLYQYI